MASRRDTFFKYLSESGKINALDTGSMVAWYNWDESFGSNKYILNSKHENPQQDTIIDSLYVDAEKSPLYQVSTGEGYAHVSGKGYFDSETRFEKIGAFHGDEWLTYIDFGPYDRKENLDKGKVIMTTMSSPSDGSGFTLGVNGANRIFFEFINEDGYKETVTANALEMSKRNLISIAYSNKVETTTSGAIYDGNGSILHATSETGATSSYIEITHHDVSTYPTAADSAGARKIRIDNVPHIKSTVLSLGSYPSMDSSCTGYSGYLNDFVLFSGNTLTSSARNLGARAFVLDDYTASQTGRDIFYEAIITGSGVVSTQVTGTGITGYELKSTSGVPGFTPSGAVVYFMSGVTGQLSGDVVSFATGVSGEFTGSGNFTFTDNFIYKSIDDISGVRSYFQRKETAEIAPLNPTVILEYAPSGMTFHDPLDPNETIEIRVFTGLAATGSNPSLGLPSGATQTSFGQLSGSESPIGLGEELHTGPREPFRIQLPDPGEPEILFGYRRTNLGLHGRRESETFYTPLGNFHWPEGTPKEQMWNEWIERTEGIKSPHERRRFICSANLYINGLLALEGSPNEKGIMPSSSGDYFIKNGQEVFSRDEQYYTTDIQKAVDGTNIGSLETKRPILNGRDHITLDDLSNDGVSSRLDCPKPLVKPYISGETHYSYTGTEYIHSDPHINGVKLNSGIHYSVTGNVLYIWREKLHELPTGTIIFAPRPPHTNVHTISGVSGRNHFFPFPLPFKPHIIRNGCRIRQEDWHPLPDEHSLMNCELRIPENEDILYLNHTGFFNQ